MARTKPIKIHGDKHPLSINFKKLDQYNLEKTKFDEIAFFEWLIIKRMSFGSETFYYQQNRIIQELGIKRGRLESIKRKFKEYGLKSELKGVFNKTYYTVLNKFIKKFVKNHIKQDYQLVFLDNVNNLEFAGRVTISSRSRKRVLDFIKELNDNFNARRRMHSDTLRDHTYPPSQLAYNEKSIRQLAQLIKNRDAEVIKNSFCAFIDALLKGDETSFHPLNNFSSYDPKLDSFPIFDRYLNVFNRNYIVEENKSWRGM